jgi:hypothetical protein
LQSAGLKSVKMISCIKLQIKRVKGEKSKLESELRGDKKNDVMYDPSYVSCKAAKKLIIYLLFSLVLCW